VADTNSRDWRKSLPMAATSVRFLLAPLLFIGLLDSNSGDGNSFWRFVAAVIFIIASLTDWLDGYWARKYNAESNMGKFMDPIADKVLVLAALVDNYFSTRYFYRRLALGSCCESSCDRRKAHRKVEDSLANGGNSLHVD